MQRVVHMLLVMSMPTFVFSTDIQADKAQKAVEQDSVGLVNITNNNAHKIEVKNDHVVSLVAPPEKDPYDCSGCITVQELKRRIFMMPKAKLVHTLITLENRPRMRCCKALWACEACALYGDIKSFTADEYKKLVATQGGKEFVKALRKQGNCSSKMYEFLIRQVKDEVLA